MSAPTAITKPITLEVRQPGATNPKSRTGSGGQPMATVFFTMDIGGKKQLYRAVIHRKLGDKQEQQGTAYWDKITQSIQAPLNFARLQANKDGLSRMGRSYTFDLDTNQCTVSAKADLSVLDKTKKVFGREVRTTDTTTVAIAPGSLAPIKEELMNQKRDGQLFSALPYQPKAEKIEKEKDKPKPPTQTTFIQGQPIGLKNRGANCWANAVFQMILNTSSMVKGINALPDDVNDNDGLYAELKKLVASYEAEQRSFAGKTLESYIANAVTGEQLRAVLGKIYAARNPPTERTPVVINPFTAPDGNPNADAQEALNLIAGAIKANIEENELPAYYTRVSQINHEGHVQIVRLPDDREREYDFFHTFPLAVADASDTQPLGEQFAAKFNGTRTIGTGPTASERPYSYRFETSPQELFLQFNRSGPTLNTPLQGDPLNLRLNARDVLREDIIVDGETPEFLDLEADSFVVYMPGQKEADGHFVTFVKKRVGAEDKWFLCNDERVVGVPTEIVAKAIKHSYFIHYKKPTHS